MNIDALFKNGYMLHDIFNGYPEDSLYQFQVDCMDYLHSASHFYNEAYDYYHERNEIKFYDSGDMIPSFEMKRIQPREEVMFRNFREAYINLIFFIESFINSVGFNAFLLGIGNSIEEKNQLKGIKSISKNGRNIYCTIKDKIEKFPKIIGNSIVDIGAEPYKSYLDISVELRNQYVHSSPEKGKTSYSVNDWKKKCDDMIDYQCFDLLDTFWKGCYPSQPFPKIIFNAFNGSSFKGHQGKYVLME